MKRILIALAVTFLGSQASAALSGYWDSVKVIQAILGAEQTGDALRQQPVERIEEAPGGYVVSSRDCRATVKVTRTTPTKPGPTAFTLAIGKGRCG